MAELQPNSIAETNPYAPTASTSALEQELSRELIQSKETVYEPSSFGWTALRWFAVCFISAVPSFLLGLSITRGQFAAMLIGISIFWVGYTFADYLTARQTWRQKKLIRRTLKTMYGTRIAITILFPIAYILDLYCGAIAIGITQSIAGQEVMSGQEMVRFDVVLLTTLVQGTIMNAVLAVYGLLVLIILAVVGAMLR